MEHDYYERQLEIKDRQIEDLKTILRHRSEELRHVKESYRILLEKHYGVEFVEDMERDIAFQDADWGDEDAR